MSKRKNQYWVLALEGKEPEIFTSWAECEKKMRGTSRPIDHGFPTKEEADEFAAGKWRGEPISEEARAWLEGYKLKEGQLKQDTELDISALSSCLTDFPGKLPKFAAYVDGSYNETSKTYGFGVVFLCDGRIGKLYGGGTEKTLADMRNDAGELLACMEAIKHAEALGVPELTIICDCEIIRWAYYGCGKEMLTQAAGQYMYDVREKMEIKMKSIARDFASAQVRDDVRSHEPGEGPGIALADQLARKGAGITD